MVSPASQFLMPSSQQSPATRLPTSHCGPRAPHAPQHLQNTPSPPGRPAPPASLPAAKPTVRFRNKPLHFKRLKTPERSAGLATVPRIKGKSPPKPVKDLCASPSHTGFVSVASPSLPFARVPSPPVRLHLTQSHLDFQGYRGLSSPPPTEVPRGAGTVPRRGTRQAHGPPVSGNERRYRFPGTGAPSAEPGSPPSSNAAARVLHPPAAASPGARSGPPASSPSTTSAAHSGRHAMHAE